MKYKHKYTNYIVIHIILLYYSFKSHNGGLVRTEEFRKPAHACSHNQLHTPAHCYQYISPKAHQTFPVQSLNFCPNSWTNSPSNVHTITVWDQREVINKWLSPVAGQSQSWAVMALIIRYNYDIDIVQLQHLNRSDPTANQGLTWFVNLGSTCTLTRV